MNNNNDIDVYTNNPDEGRSREGVVNNNPQGSDTTYTRGEAPNELMASSTREQALQASAQKGPGPISTGYQSGGSSDSSNVGGYSQPESGFGPDAQGGFAQPQSGYNQSGFNQPGTYSESQGDIQPRNDGLQDTMGSGYDPHNEGVNAADLAQQGYDPTHSGVRHAQNQPGQVIDTPGREVGTSWGEDEQMGSSTDTPDRRNPSM